MPSLQSLQQRDAEHHLHPFTNTGALNRKGTRIITRGEGVYLWDAQGNRILDGMSGLWCVNLGYGQQELIDAAQQQLQTLPYYNTFFQTSHPAAISLAEKLADITPGDLNRLFFTNSGSEAIDTIIRLVRYFWSLKGKPEKHILISRHNAYHGSTLAAASLGGMRPMHRQGAPLVPGIEHICQPYWYGEADGLSPAEFGRQCALALEQKLIDVGPENVAAFVAEPIQGAGGVIVPPDSYWPEIQRICREYDILLAADEVICGFGRTGAWFASDTFAIQPDIMSMAKGLSSGYLPIAAVAVGDRIAEQLISANEDFNHGFTYSGHPTAAAVALKTIEVMERDQVIPCVAEDTGPYFQQRLRSVLGDHPLVGHIEGRGLMAGIALVKDKETHSPFPAGTDLGLICRDHCFKQGLIMRAVGNRMVLAPPLIITHAEIDELCAIAKRCFDLTLASTRAAGSS